MKPFVFVPAILALCMTMAVSPVLGGKIVSDQPAVDCVQLQESAEDKGKFEWKWIVGWNWVFADNQAQIMEAEERPVNDNPLKLGVSMMMNDGKPSGFDRGHVSSNVPLKTMLTLWARHYERERPEYVKFKVQFNLKSGRNAEFWLDTTQYSCTREEPNIGFRSEDVNRVNFYRRVRRKH